MIRTCATGTCSRGGGANVGRHRERVRASEARARPSSVPAPLDRPGPAQRRPVGAVVKRRRRRAHTHPARSGVRARASENVDGRERQCVCARGGVCQAAAWCVCAREFCARSLRCSPAAAALPLARRCRSLYSRRRPIVCARVRVARVYNAVRVRAWPSRRQSERE